MYTLTVDMMGLTGLKIALLFGHLFLFAALAFLIALRHKRRENSDA